MRTAPRVIMAGLLVLLVGVAVLAVTARGDKVSDLDGTSWELTGWSMSSIDPRDFAITAAFGDGRMSGRSAINQYSGDYTASADGDFVLGEIMSTLMGGPEPEMAAEAAYYQLLRSARAYQIDSAELRLLDGDGNEQLIFAAAVP